MMVSQLKTLVDRVVGAQPTPHTLRIDINGWRVQVRANHAELIDILRNYYHSFLADSAEAEIDIVVLEQPSDDFGLDYQVKQPDPGKTRLKDAYVDFPDGRVLKKLRTGMVFMYGPAGNVALGPSIANSNQVVNFINNRFVQAELDAGALLCHAAGVCAGQDGLAIAGMSNRGKSTLSLRLVERGLDFVTNDRLLMKRGDDRLMMWGLPKFPRVNPGTLLHHERLRELLPREEAEELAELPREELWTYEQKYDVDVDRVFGAGRVRLAAEMRGLVILTWQLGGGPVRLERVDLSKRADLLEAAYMKLPTIHQFVPPGEQPPDYSPARYQAVLGDTPTYILEGGVDFDEAAALCEELLRDG
jgi:HprK-related kinase B